ncbi:hypothetical protein LA080_002123 [Diaporthe eres]|nr:hypothetical protein LA080_002123 [Diaporthe eres]
MLSDSAAIRVITVMTLFYLPSSFVSGFFGMGFFATADATLAGWTVSPYLWIYLIVALLLTALTICVKPTKFVV